MKRYFRLIGRDLVFAVVKYYDAAGHIPSVVGHTLDGKSETCARVEDVTFLLHPAEVHEIEAEAARKKQSRGETLTKAERETLMAWEDDHSHGHSKVESRARSHAEIEAAWWRFV